MTTSNSMPVRSLREPLLEGISRISSIERVTAQPPSESSQTQYIEVAVDASANSANNSQANQENGYSPYLFFSSVGMVFTLVLVSFTILELLDGFRASAFATLKSWRGIPCSKCRYFSKNYHLRCAVRPSDVLTTRATNCSDFCPRHKDIPDQEMPADSTTGNRQKH